MKIPAKLFLIPNSREMLSEMLNIQYNKNVNLAHFSRRCGFLSRSYLLEIINGKKGLSKEALRKITSALKVDRMIIDYFRFLAFLDFPKIKPKNLSDLEIRAKLKEIKNIVFNTATHDKSVDLENIFSKPIYYRLFCAINTHGNTIEEIAKKISKDETSIEKYLLEFIKLNFVYKNGNRYFLQLQNLKNLNMKNKDYVKHLTMEVCREILGNLKISSIVEKDFYNFSVISIDSSRQNEFKVKLKNYLMELMEEFQDNSGESISELFVCMRN